MIIVFQILFFIILAIVIINGIRQYVKNENSPVISTKAQLINRKKDVSTTMDANNVMHHNETFKLEFKLDTGSEVKFVVNRRIFYELEEFEWGILTFQGTRFLRFQWNDRTVEK